jgi:hypothetical protein
MFNIIELRISRFEINPFYIIFLSRLCARFYEQCIIIISIMHVFIYKKNMEIKFI